MLGVDTLVEFKSLRRPYRGRDLDRLVGYGHQWYVATPGRLRKRGDLVLALVVPARTKALTRAVADLGYVWEPLEPGVLAIDRRDVRGGGGGSAGRGGRE